jgi:hypothetical protein
MTARPKLIDLFCGRGGWSIPALERGWRCIGYDTTDHGYPGELRLRELPIALHELTEQNATLIVASPPCEDFARCHLPWLRTVTNPSTELLEWSISLIGQTNCPVIVECSRFAGWHVPGGRYIRPYTFWGDLPLLMPTYRHSKDRARGSSNQPRTQRAARAATIPRQIAEWIIELKTPGREKTCN